jgi:hypothetical protein
MTGRCFLRLGREAWSNSLPPESNSRWDGTASDRCIAALIGRRLLSSIELEQLYPGRRLTLAIASERMVL